MGGGYDNGGLNILDLTNFIPALKCVWLRRILKSCTDWAHLFETNYGSEFTKNLADFGDHFLQSNYKENPNPFWSDVFESWQRVIRNSKVAKGNIFQNPIWFNSCLKINNLPVFYKQWYDKGVKVIGDLFQNGILMSFENFKTRFDIQNICILKYQGLCNCIKEYFRKHNIDLQQLPIMCYPYKPLQIYILTKSDKGCRDFYDILNVNVDFPTSYGKWNIIYNIDKHNMQKIFSNCFKITSNTTFCWLQYRILHRILPFKSYLLKSGVTDNDKCTFCGEFKEDIIHVFL